MFFSLQATDLGHMTDDLFLASGLAGVAGGAFLIMVLISAAIYVYGAFALMIIAKRTKTKNAWLAWIPIGNIYLMTQIGKLSGAWTFGIFLSIIPMIGSLLVVALSAYLWSKVAKVRKRPEWWGILMVLPLINLVFMGILAWGKK